MANAIDSPLTDRSSTSPSSAADYESLAKAMWKRASDGM